MTDPHAVRHECLEELRKLGHVLDHLSRSLRDSDLVLARKLYGASQRAFYIRGRWAALKPQPEVFKNPGKQTLNRSEIEED